MKPTRYWIAVISKEHALRGLEGGFIQINHGKDAPLRRLTPGDWVVIYSPKLALDSKTPYQQFTGIGQVDDEPIYQFKMSEEFVPFRRKITFHKAAETPIAPLIDHLDFIPNKKAWGSPFRFGFFEIKEPDFKRIREKMLPDEQ